MEKFKKLFDARVSYLLLFGVLAAFVSCQEDSLMLRGSDCSILSMSIVDGQDTFYVKTYPDSLVAIVDFKTDMENAVVDLRISEGAVIVPSIEDVEDWSRPMQFTVTSASGDASQVYSYIFRRETISKSYCRENVYLTAQEDVNEFGSKGYVRVRSIVINEREEGGITDLSPLASIQEIDNNLTIKGYSGKDVVLDNLMKVASFDIKVPSVENISMKSLVDINNLYIGQINEEFSTNYPSIDSLAHMDFSALKHIKGNLILSFFNMDENYSVSGFENLEQVDGDVVFSFNTKDFKTFSKLTSLRGFTVQGTVQSFEGLENIKEVKATFITNFLRGAQSLLPFAPEKIHSVSLRSSQSLTSLDFCKNLTEIYDFEISGGYTFTSLAGMENIKVITNGLYIKYTQIENLDALNNLESVGSILKFQYNTKLSDFSGLKKCLETFDGEWDVTGNAQNPTVDEVLNN